MVDVGHGILKSQFIYLYIYITAKKFAAENPWLEDEFPIWDVIFLGATCQLQNVWLRTFTTRGMKIGFRMSKIQKLSSVMNTLNASNLEFMFKVTFYGFYHG